MRIELLDDVVISDEVWRSGQEIELDDAEARRLIDGGRARPAPVRLEVHDCVQEGVCVS